MAAATRSQADMMLHSQHLHRVDCSEYQLVVFFRATEEEEEEEELAG